MSSEVLFYMSFRFLSLRRTQSFQASLVKSVGAASLPLMMSQAPAQTRTAQQEALKHGNSCGPE